MAISPGEDVGKEEPLCTSGNIRWVDHYGIQCGCSQKAKNRTTDCPAAPQRHWRTHDRCTVHDRESLDIRQQRKTKRKRETLVHLQRKGKLWYLQEMGQYKVFSLIYRSERRRGPARKGVGRTGKDWQRGMTAEHRYKHAWNCQNKTHWLTFKN